MRTNEMLEEYSPEEARKAGELKFLEWLFLLQQLVAVIVIVSVIINPLPSMKVLNVLEIVSQNVPLGGLIPLLVLHIGVILLIFLFRKPFVLILLAGWIAGMVLFSILEFFLKGFGVYNFIGFALMVFWGIYFLTSRRMKVRLFFDEAYARASRTIICPHCKREVLLDSEDCGDSLTEDERFTALCERIKSTYVPSEVRSVQIELLEERFGQKALDFLKQQYEKQIQSSAPVTKISAALARAISKHEKKIQ